MDRLTIRGCTGGMNADMTLVTGGTGKTGRRVAERLAARGIPVRIGSRSGEPRFDWEDRDTWAPALAGVDAVYLAYQPDLAFPGAAEAIEAFVDLAAVRGIRRLVLVSGRGEPEAQRCEQVMQGRNRDGTVVRAAMFSQNFSEHFLLEPVRSGVVAFPGWDQGEPFVDADDIADVAVAALTEGGHTGQVYEVTGPRLLTFAEAVGEIAEASGREVRYVPVSPQEYAAGLVAHGGVPTEVASFLASLFGSFLDGHNACLADGVQRALGRPPRDFADYAQATAATGVWT